MGYSISFNPKKTTDFNPNSSNNTNPFIGNDAANSLYVPSCDQNQYQKDRLKAYWETFVANYGVRIEFWSYGYDMNQHDFLYGEHPLAGFNGPRLLKAYPEITNESRLLAKFGIMTDNDATLLIPISEFQRVWGGTKPKIGDIWRIKDAACDRPEEIGPRIFQISDKVDTINPVDFLGGHYVWKLSSKRFDYSYQPNAPVEEGLGELSDVPFFGEMFPDDKTDKSKESYTDKSDNAQEKAKENYDNNTKDKGFPYGNYI